MRISYFILPASLVHRVVSSGTPDHYWDPESAKDCVEWYNHEFSESCEQVRDYFTITPEQFHKWNPSIGLDCKPWYTFQSYCIVTQERLDNTPKPSTSSSQVPTSTTTTSSTPAPSPTTWIDRGCYVERLARPILKQNMTPNGDASLTIPKCKAICYRQAYTVAGVQEGNQCWCGYSIPGEWALDKTECNIPCTGDKTTICGGKERLNIFLAKQNESPSSTVTSASSSTNTQVASSSTNTQIVSSSKTVNVASASKTSGADKDMAMFWQN